MNAPYSASPSPRLGRLRRLGACLAAFVAAWVVAGAAAPPSEASAPDVVTLKDGKKLEGRVVRDTSREVVVRVGSQERKASAQDVVSVSSAARKLKEALAIWERLSPANTAAVAELARECRAFGLDAEARLFALYGLTIAPTDETLHLFAGHEKRGETWFVRNGLRREAFAKRFERTLDWSEAWVFDTTHFVVRCNLTLRDAVTCAIELELFYRAFLSWFAEDLPLYEPGARMKANVYANNAEYPEGGGRSAYFETGPNVLHVNASAGLELGALIHEATHQLLHNTASNTKASLGAIPAWLDEGLAEYMAACREGVGSRATYSKGKPNREHFALHRGTDKPYDLSRVLTMDHGDFMASSNAALKYSQAYTLVHFCLHGGGDEQRERFVDFFQRAYAGKSSATAFKDAMAIKDKAFESAWREYVAHEG